MTKHQAIALVLAALLQAGCENDATSYQSVDGAAGSFTLIREQRWLWDKNAAVAIVVARHPDCQRRYPLRPTPAEAARVELLQAGPQQFLVRQGDDWYSADTATCSLQAAAVPAPGAPLVALGAFERQGGKLAFVPRPSRN